MTSASDRERARACGALSAAVVQIPPVPLLVIGTESLVSVNVPAPPPQRPLLRGWRLAHLVRCYSHTDSQ